MKAGEFRFTFPLQWLMNRKGSSVVDGSYEEWVASGETAALVERLPWSFHNVFPILLSRAANLYNYGTIMEGFSSQKFVHILLVCNAILLRCSGQSFCLCFHVNPIIIIIIIMSLFSFQHKMKASLNSCCGYWHTHYTCHYGLVSGLGQNFIICQGADDNFPTLSETHCGICNVHQPVLADGSFSLTSS